MTADDPAPGTTAQCTTLSVLIPVYNEVDTVAALIERVEAVSLRGLDREIVVVDDASSDGSAAILVELEREGRIRLLRHAQNRGKGGALATAFGAARGDVLLIQDADLEYDPAEYPRLLAPILDGRCPVVFGARVDHEPPPLWYLPLWGNRLLTASFNLCFGCHLADVFVCYKAFTRAAVAGLTLQSARFEVEIELAANCMGRGLRIVQVPISYRRRSWQEGKKITYRDGWRALATILSLRCRLMRQRRGGAMAKRRRRAPAPPQC